MVFFFVLLLFFRYQCIFCEVKGCRRTQFGSGSRTYFIMNNIYLCSVYFYLSSFSGRGISASFWLRLVASFSRSSELRAHFETHKWEPLVKAPSTWRTKSSKQEHKLWSQFLPNIPKIWKLFFLYWAQLLPRLFPDCLSVRVRDFKWDELTLL